MNDLTHGALLAYAYEDICPNPYQVHGDRRFRGPDFDDLVESVRVNGVRQPPPARRHPTLPGKIQLQSGHRRLAASKVARPGELFFVLLRDMDEIEMFEGCAEENLQRAGINDIERAQLMEQYKTLKPTATNADIARVFRLKDPASVTNMRKLLRLPAALQELVAADKLPDAYARQLVAVATVNEKAAIAIGKKVAEAGKSEKANVFDAETQLHYRNQMQELKLGWSDDWLADEPKEVETDLGDGDHIVGGCAGCVFHVQTYCARKACFDVKRALWTDLELARVAAKVKIPTAAETETTTVLFKGAYDDDDLARMVLNQAPKEVRALLRLVPYTSSQYNYLQHVLESPLVTLAATNKAAVDTWIGNHRARSAFSSKKEKVEKPAAETEAQRKKRVEAEKQEQALARAARAKLWKSKYDALWLVENAARLAGPQLRIEGDLLKSVEALFAKEYNINSDVRERVLAPLLNNLRTEQEARQSDALRRVHIALCVLGDYGVANSNGRPDYERAHAHILERAAFSPEKKNKYGGHEMAQGLGVTLPKDWDIPPIHRTAFNCWQCGKFAGNVSEQLTGRDIKEDGWIDNGKDGVFCSYSHEQDYYAKSASDFFRSVEKDRKATRTNGKKVAAKAKTKASKRRR